MNVLKNYFRKVLSILRAKELIGGLEVSDEAFRFALFDGNAWRFKAARFSPGTVVLGEVKDRVQFLSAIQELRTEIFGKSRTKRKIMVILSISSVEIYSQIFSLPFLEGENLLKAVALNIQMAAPTKVENLYSGWEVIEEDKGAFRLEVLSSFIKRPIIDGMMELFQEAGFVVVAIEPRALTLSRLVVREGSGFDPGAPAILLDMNTNGMNFVIMRKEHFYFEYHSPWQDIQDEKGNVSLENFKKSVIRNMHQILNFYSQHSVGEMHDVYIMSSTLRDELTRVLQENFSLTPHFLELRELPSLDPQWFAATGSGLRGLTSRRMDKELSLLGVSAYDTYVQARLTNFFGFWRIVFPVAFGLFLIAITLGDIFLASLHQSIDARRASVQISSQELQDLSALTQEITAFNTSVNLVRNTESSMSPRGSIFVHMFSVLNAQNITMSQISLSQSGAVSFSGSAPTVAQISALKQTLQSDPAFSHVDVPLTSIVASGQVVNFSMTFQVALNPPKL